MMSDPECTGTWGRYQKVQDGDTVIESQTCLGCGDVWIILRDGNATRSGMGPTRTEAMREALSPVRLPTLG